MLNQNLNQNSTAVTINADVEKLALLKQFMEQNNISPNVLKTITKQSKDNFSYIDDTKTIASCNACDEEFKVNDIPSEFVDVCRKSGICLKCASIFAQADALRANLRNKNITSHGNKIIVNGGKSVGKRLQQMFSDAIASENFTEEILANFLDASYSSKVLKFSSYPFLTDITDITDEEQSNNKDFYKRYYSQSYQIFGKKIKLCSQIFDKQFLACQQEFTKLNLISKEY